MGDGSDPRKVALVTELLTLTNNTRLSDDLNVSRPTQFSHNFPHRVGDKKLVRIRVFNQTPRNKAAYTLALCLFASSHASHMRPPCVPVRRHRSLLLGSETHGDATPQRCSTSPSPCVSSQSAANQPDPHRLAPCLFLSFPVSPRPCPCSRPVARCWETEPRLRPSQSSGLLGAIVMRDCV